MRIGITFPQNELSGDPEALRRFGLAAESLGCDHLLMYDHVVGAVRGVLRDPPVPERSYDDRDPFHDPLVAFGFLAALTDRIELVTGTLILPQRQTALVARKAADVEILSGGRLRLGVGIGYNPVEYHALGQQWRTRGRRLDEQIPYLRELWSGRAMTFSGRFDQIDQAAVHPPPAQRIPVWIEGSSDAAYRRAARPGDGFIFGYGMRGEALQAWARVQALLREEGRAIKDFRAVFNLLPEHEGSWLGETLASLPRLREAGATDVTLTSARNGLSSLEQHLEFIAELKDGADSALR